MSAPIYSPFAKPLYIMLKPASSACNLSCDYCYYLQKSKYYKAAPTRFMTDSLLEKFVKEYIESQTTPYINFTWHGGESLLRDINFYKKALKYQAHYGKGRVIENAIQTNGTLLTDDWCKFFNKYNFLVGVSIDGPKYVHDAYRKTRQGAPTFDNVMRGIDLLKKHNCQWNAMAVVNNLNAKNPGEFYRFFKDIGAKFIQFTPIVERISADGSLANAKDSIGYNLADYSVSPSDWGNFLIEIFDIWVRQDVGDVFVQIFDATLANWMGQMPGVCVYAKTCGHAGVMEFNGDVYSCDHFVFPDYKLGNINKNTLIEMMYSPEQLQFGADKHKNLPLQCKECRWLFACNGECPKNRFAIAKDGSGNLNYLCKGYYRFFEYVAPYMDIMKAELMAGRAPANIMKMI